VDTAKRQAQELGHSFEEELKRLLVHGLVHLLGYDHELGGEEEKKFFELEEFVLKGL
jgi:probable rRNA maturation factor